MEKTMSDNLIVDLFKAYFDARKHKRNTINQLAFELELEKNLFQLYNELRWYRYVPARSVAFIVDRPVKREIFCADFRDRVIHHLLFNYINPVLDRRFIEDSYSCRVGRGTLFGQERLERGMRAATDNFTREAWILKLDIRGYFMSINRKILYDKLIFHMEKPSILWEGINMELVRYLIRVIVFNDPVDNCLIKGQRTNWEGLPPSKSLFHSQEGCGLPIGNLTSQLFSNVYLHEFDTWMKYHHRLKYYGRYVDDFYIIHPDKDYLKGLIPQIRTFLADELQLTLHPNKIYLQSVHQGVDFLGATHKPYYRLAGRRAKHNFYKLIHQANDYFCNHSEPDQKDIEQFCAQMNSYLGYLGQQNTMKLRLNALFSLLSDNAALQVRKYGLRKMLPLKPDADRLILPEDLSDLN